GLLREASRGILPPDIIERKKNPYPRTLDAEYEERIKNMLGERVLDPSSPIKNLLNTKTLESMMRQQHDTNKRYTARAQLYGWIIQLDYFLRTNGITVF
ncbi:MAG: asparagine synthetase B, partial [Clostridiaceae bacterium]|nr:asparagine synthetase B [Clostridiaceae bacterium]